MSPASGKVDWRAVVALMRQDARELGREPGQASRFLRRYHCTVDALASQLRRGWGINAHEMQAISVLWEFGRMTMTDLGHRIPLSRAAVTTLTDRLEHLGFVRRIPDPTDRRRILLEVTERVEEEFARVHGAWDDRVDDYVNALEPDVWSRVVDVLADLRELARREADELRAMSREQIEQLGGTRRPLRARDQHMAPTWW